MNILVAPSGFKESLDPHGAADCIKAGILRAVPDAKVRKVPLFDGGEGFAHALVASTGGEHKRLNVTGPVMEKVDAYYGFLGGRQPRTAVIEIAEAAGLRLVPKDRRNPANTTTYGVGELINAALNEGADRILIGCGDSGTSDGGVGMCQALGARFFDKEGYELPPATGGGALGNLARIDLSGVHPRLKQVRVDVLCNWKNVLCGPNGVARVYGPQKGATADQVDQLSLALETYAAIVKRAIGIDVGTIPGGGASGGLGAGLVLMGATLRPRFEAIIEYFGIEKLFDECDLIFTAEGGIDYQTPRGKIPGEVALRAKRRGLPVVAIAGTIGTGAAVNYDAGIDAFTSIIQGPTSLEDAVAHAPKLLSESAESAMRMVMIGHRLAKVDDKPKGRDRALQWMSQGGDSFQLQIPGPIFKFLLIFMSFYLLFSRALFAAEH
ncbi:glycerate kinase [Coccidioides immitis RS]|uniref:Glycerate kinase n=1 Tax=Coccidioides immitis (strain RS) TaxID=246410 RepID=A0A0E1S4H3_COCIM|nr:glycerate kinase [Coccidioides immitis RS]EAS35180.1 glycerate kinase [Coccidioides immitis RS]